MNYMFDVLGENYFIDFDEIEKYIDMSEGEIVSKENSSEMKINIIKYELVKMMLETIISEEIEMDDNLGLKNKYKELSIPFKIAFNSLLNKKLINHY